MKLASLNCALPSLKSSNATIDSENVGKPLKKSFRTNVQHPHSQKYWDKVSNKYRIEEYEDLKFNNGGQERHYHHDPRTRQIAARQTRPIQSHRGAANHPIKPSSRDTQEHYYHDKKTNRRRTSRRSSDVWEDRDHPYDPQHYDDILRVEESAYIDLNFSGLSVVDNEKAKYTDPKFLFQEYIRLKKIADGLEPGTIRDKRRLILNGAEPILLQGGGRYHRTLETKSSIAEKQPIQRTKSSIAEKRPIQRAVPLMTSDVPNKRELYIRPVSPSPKNSTHRAMRDFDNPLVEAQNRASNRHPTKQHGHHYSMEKHQPRPRLISPQNTVDTDYTRKIYSYADSDASESEEEDVNDSISTLSSVSANGLHKIKNRDNNTAIVEHFQRQRANPTRESDINSKACLPKWNKVQGIVPKDRYNTLEESPPKMRYMKQAAQRKPRKSLEFGYI